jgi:VCBS repeat-containing protein
MLKSRKLRVFAAVVVAVGAMGVVAMSSGGAEPSAVHLHLGSDGRYVKFGSTTQTLSTSSNSCALSTTPTLLNVTSTGTASSPGLGTDSIGVKSKSGANGTPCGQVDSTESVTIKPGTSISSRTFSGLRLDLEITGNAIAKLTLSRGTTSAVYQLQTGTSITAAQAAEADYDKTAPYEVSSSPGDTTDACAAPNISGPNSGSNDNCEWTVQPGFNFDTATLTTVSAGTVAIEGSNDFGNNTAFDSVFYLSNGAPTPTNDTVSTNEDTAVSGNVLTNDSDPDGNPLSASLVSGPSHGTLTLAGTGAFTYTPAANYNGGDSFTYTASDGQLGTNATVSITVASVDDPPVAQDDSAEVNQHEYVDIPVLANDSDIDSSTLTPSNIGSITPAGATATVNGDGTVRYTAPSSFTGAGSFTYKASDGTLTSNVATVNVTVFPAICSNDTVSDADGATTGSFTRLDDSFACKRYALDASAADDTVLFQPTGANLVNYRGFVSFGANPAYTPGDPVVLNLAYDPAGGNTFQPVQWCTAPQFDGSHQVTSATLPSGQTWCIASAATDGDANGVPVTTFQVFGHDDPKFALR